MSKIEVWQKKSTISEPPVAKKVMRALGLRRFGVVRVHKDNNCIRGMLNKVKHLVSFKLIP